MPSSSSARRKPPLNPVKPVSLLTVLVAALRDASAFTLPADKILSSLFEKNRGLGPRERHVLAECFYFAIRRWTWLEAITTGRPIASRPSSELSASQLRAMSVMAGFLVDKDKILRLTAGELHWAESQSAALSTISAQYRFCVPDWIWGDWVDQIGEEEASHLAAYLDQEAPLDLRLNLTQGQGLAHLREELSLAGIAAHPIDWLPEGLRCQGRPALQGLAAFKQGHFEVQDAGSQLLARLCAPQRGQTVVDFCAGAGGKTLALGALMRNSGRIYALDTSSSRLARLKPRLARSGLSNVWAIAIQGLNDLRIKRLKAKADLVLVDAPCTGLGTLRRNPDLKWRQTSEGLSDLLALQASILSAAASLVKSGGHLVYATCSLKREENEQQVEAFLQLHPEFSIDSAERILSRQGIEPKPEAQWFGEHGELRLWPHRSDTDGFFGVNLIRA